jgi:hypothetical protein
MGKATPRTSERDIGNLIVAYWREVLEAGGQFDRMELRQRLQNALEPENRGKRVPRVRVEVVVDQDLDDTTRLVWIAVPSPDLDTPADWRRFVEEYERDEDKLLTLGKSVLFGCGR